MKSKPSDSAAEDHLDIAGLNSGEDINDARKMEREQRFFSEIAQQTPESIICTDTDFRIIYVNPAAQELFGWTMKELLGQPADIINAEPHADQIQRDIHERISSGQVVEGEALNRRKDNNTFVCHYKVAPLFDSQGEIMAYMGVQRDVTKQKMLEAALKSSLHETEALLQATVRDMTEQVAMETQLSHSRKLEAVARVWQSPLRSWSTNTKAH